MFLKSVKNTKCVVNMGSFKLKMHQNTFSAMAPPGPRWGSLQHPPDSLAGGRGLAAPSPKSHPALGPLDLDLRPLGPQYSALRTSMFGPSGLRTSCLWHSNPPHRCLAIRAWNASGSEKNHDFRPIPRFVSELMQDRSTVTIEGK